MLSALSGLVTLLLVYLALGAFLLMCGVIVVESDDDPPFSGPLDFLLTYALAVALGPVMAALSLMGRDP